jgi:bacterioferritin (cytochrome b1)
LRAIRRCDAVARRPAVQRLRSEMPQGEEDQVDCIEAQLELTARIGRENDIRRQSGPAE